MKKVIIALLGVLAMLAAAIGISNAEPGPNDSNEHGLCTAYFNGQKNGHDKNGQPGPFQALEDTAREYTDTDDADNDGDEGADEGETTPDPSDDENTDLSAAENIVNYCDATTTIGGNPDHGRFTCDPDKDDNPANGNQPECSENEGPGNS